MYFKNLALLLLDTFLLNMFFFIPLIDHASVYLNITYVVNSRYSLLMLLFLFVCIYIIVIMIVFTMLLECIAITITITIVIMSGMIRGVFVGTLVTMMFLFYLLRFVLLDDDTGDEMIFLLHHLTFIVLCAHALDRMFI